MTGIVRDYQAWLASPLASMGHTYPGVGNWPGSASRATENETPLPPMREAVGKGGYQAAADRTFGPDLGRLGISPQSAAGFLTGAANSVVNGVRSAAQSFDRLLSYRPGEEDPQAPVDAFNLASMVGTSSIGAGVPRGALTAGAANRADRRFMSPELRAQRLETIRRLHAEGANDAAIAAELGMDHSNVARMRRAETDLGPNDLGGARRPTADAIAQREATIRRMHAEGATRQQIADELGLRSRGHVHRIMDDMGLLESGPARPPAQRAPVNPFEAMMQQGMDHNQIASALRISPQSALQQMVAYRRSRLDARGAPLPAQQPVTEPPQQGDRPPVLSSTGLGSVLTERLTPEQQIERLRQFAPELVEQLQALHGLQRQHFPGSANEPSPLLYDLDPPADAPPSVIEAAAALQQAIQARMRPSNGPEMMRLGGPLPAAGPRRPPREDFIDGLQDITGYWGDDEVYEHNSRLDAGIMRDPPADADASRIQSIDSDEMMNRAAARPLNARGRFGVPERAPVDMPVGSWRTETRRSRTDRRN